MIVEPLVIPLWSSMAKGIALILIFTLVNVITSLILGIRKKELLAVLVTNIMVKSIMIYIYQVLLGVLNLYIPFLNILLLIPTIIIEGIIYNKVLRHKKLKGITVSIICNLNIAQILLLVLEIS